MRLPTRTLLVAALTATPAVISAQSAGSLPRVLELPASTRAMALGDAYMMNANHADALFYHPALLADASGFGLEVQRWGNQSTSSAASAALQWLGGGIGIGLITLQYSGPGSGTSAAPTGQDHLFESGTWPVSERVAVLGYARELFGIDFGVAGKLVEERIDLAQESVALLDVGAATDLGPLRVALTVRDWGEDPLVDPVESTPRVVLGAGSYGRPLGIFDVGLTAAAHWSEDRTTVSGGLEVGYWPIRGRTFVGRVGFQDPPAGSAMSAVSMGFAYWGDNVTIEWAFRPRDGADEGGTHRFGLRWR
jgi:hypothetical protein